MRRAIDTSAVSAAALPSSAQHGARLAVSMAGRQMTHQRPRVGQCGGRHDLRNSRAARGAFNLAADGVEIFAQATGLPPELGAFAGLNTSGPVQSSIESVVSTAICQRSWRQRLRRARASLVRKVISFPGRVAMTKSAPSHRIATCRLYSIRTFHLYRSPVVGSTKWFPPGGTVSCVGFGTDRPRHYSALPHRAAWHRLTQSAIRVD